MLEGRIEYNKSKLLHFMLSNARVIRDNLVLETKFRNFE